MRDGLALLDEAMVAVTAEELSPIVTGIVYCGVILACQEVYEVRRAREWTARSRDWWALQPDMVAFTGRCLVHRAEIMQLDGAVAGRARGGAPRRRAIRRDGESGRRGCARYRQGELLRLQGEFAAAEEAYREASRLGWEPQPGLAQLRLAQGRTTPPSRRSAAPRRPTDAPLERARLLPAFVEIMLAVGDVDEAPDVRAYELEEIAAGYESAMLGGDRRARARSGRTSPPAATREALAALRRRVDAWQRARGAVRDRADARARRRRVPVLGDEEAAALEHDAARSIFERLGATPDLARVASRGARVTHGLSARELEVLRLVAPARPTARSPPSLVISEHTVARHVQNIFAKLGVSSRSAATAFAFEHDLV